MKTHITNSEQPVSFT